MASPHRGEKGICAARRPKRFKSIQSSLPPKPWGGKENFT